MYFFHRLASNFGNHGFYTEAQKNKAWSNGIWILQKGGEHHWSLIIIVFSEKKIINLDSLHNNFPDDVLEQLCAFVKNVFLKLKVIEFN